MTKKIVARGAACGEQETAVKTAANLNLGGNFGRRRHLQIPEISAKTVRAFFRVAALLFPLFAVSAYAQGPYRYDPVDGIPPNVVTVNGRSYAITLQAKDRGGKFDGDELGVWDVTNPRDPFGCRNRLEVGTQTCNLEGVPIRIRLKGGKENEVEITIGQNEEFAAELRHIYLWRAKSTMEKTACGKQYRIGLQGGMKSAWLFFDASISQYMTSRSSNLSQLSPKYVVVIADERGRVGEQVPIADTGCWLFYRGGKWYPAKSRSDLLFGGEPSTPAPAPAASQRPPCFESTVYFVTGSSTFDATARDLLEVLALNMPKNATRIRVVGHTDRSEASVELSERRARAVADYFHGRGVPKEQFFVEGRGDSEPAVNGSAKSEPRNRRVLVIVESDGCVAGGPAPASP